jgi:excisionase family DNA binding protein
MIEVSMLPKTRRKRLRQTGPSRSAEILDVRMAAELLTVSPDTVYELFKNGELPGRKVGRKWITTKAAVLRWIEQSFAPDAVSRAVEKGDREALAAALRSGKLRLKGGE